MSRVGMYVQRYHVDGYESQSESCERCVTRNGKTLLERCPWHWWRHAKLALFKTITLQIYAALSLFTINMITRIKIRDIDGNNFDLFNMIQRWFLYRCNFDVSKWHCYCNCFGLPKFIKSDYWSNKVLKSLISIEATWWKCRLLSSSYGGTDMYHQAKVRAITYHSRLSVCARRAQIILEGFIVVIHGICQGHKDRLALSKGYHHNPTESRFLELNSFLL